MPVPVVYTPAQPVDIKDNVLTILGTKLGHGHELTLSERLMAMTATSASVADRYGPGPADMQVAKPELPEMVKGVLASYIS